MQVCLFWQSYARACWSVWALREHLNIRWRFVGEGGLLIPADCRRTEKGGYGQIVNITFIEAKKRLITVPLALFSVCWGVN